MGEIKIEGKLTDVYHDQEDGFIVVGDEHLDRIISLIEEAYGKDIETYDDDVSAESWRLQKEYDERHRIRGPGDFFEDYKDRKETEEKIKAIPHADNPYAVKKPIRVEITVKVWDE